MTAAGVSAAWPVQEAQKLLKRLERTEVQEGEVLFETGYGPSGLPHIGTFGEVVRTTFVQQAFEDVSNRPTRLICFSDDMDGFRKVPTNIPNQESMAQYLGRPLTGVPDPFGKYESFGHHNNAKLREFLDSFGLNYTFYSSTACYKEGIFDQLLLNVLELHQSILALILPTLGPERRATYSPFLPICPHTGNVLQVAIEEYHVESGTIVYRDQQDRQVEVPVTRGGCKLQWKCDWGMRWAALGIDYEMSGKDLIDSVKLSSKICRLLGAEPPEGLSYELFLDQDARKISKSSGNGISCEEWLRYAPPESLSYFMYQSPRRAKRLSFDVIPRNVDNYFTHLDQFQSQSLKQQTDKDNPVWYVHRGDVPRIKLPLSFYMLLNLVSVCNTDDPSVLWGFITRYVPGASPEEMPILDQLVQYAVRYYENFVAPHKRYRSPQDRERHALQDLWDVLGTLDLGGCKGEQGAEEIQAEVYAVGKRHGFEDLRAWFQSLYQLLLGQDEGPRMGSFIVLYGIPETRNLIAEVLARP